LREDHPQVTQFGNQPIRGSISRVDEAFNAFFRRISLGEVPGYPRFKSARRFASAFYDEPTSWKLRGLTSTARTRRCHTPKCSLYIQGIGELALSRRATAQLRRLIERGGEARTLTITRTRSGAWRAGIGFRGVAVKALSKNAQAGGVDRGIAVTAALPDGTLLRCPPFVRTASTNIAQLSRRREEEQKNSAAYKRLNRSIAKEYRLARARSENWARHIAAEVVGRYEVIALENLNLINMTRSARGTAAQPGKGVAAKSRLNRSLQEAALGRLGHWVCVKAEEAGRRVYLVDAKNSSRCCAVCGHTSAANRRRSRFSCLACGHVEHADVNAAQVIAARGATADSLWQAQGSRPLARSVPRARRHKELGNAAGTLAAA
jgi:putative transposase